MNKQTFVVGVFLLTVCMSAFGAGRPNILLIMSDDMGYSDLGCFGSEIATPRLDALAANGLRFTQFYNGARCCPTRASLLTGLYPHQVGMGFMVRNVSMGPGYTGDLSRNGVTIAEVLRASGYHTGMVGKWHVARSHSMADTSNWPVQRGFESFYGTIRGFGSFYDPESLTRQNTFITPANDPEYRSESYYYTDAISDNAISFLRRSAGTEQPFFLYVAYTAAHWPLQAPESEIEKYRGRYDRGYDAIRRSRVERLRRLGLMDPQWTPAPTIGDWEKQPNKAWETRNMETYAAMIDRMDQGIGRIVDQLKADGRLDNTLILFLQDNGACAEPSWRKPIKQEAPHDLSPMGSDALQTRSTPPMQTRDGHWVRSGPGAMAGPADTYVGYGELWANVANTPFREYKHWVHEGGISTPLIAHWPEGIRRDRRGGLEPQVGHIIDIMATCVDLAGADYPSDFNGHRIKPLEGVSLAPAFSGRELERKQPLFWEHESNRAVRDGHWKLVAVENGPWELYDMTLDRTEMHDLSARYPDRVKALAAAWDAWAKRCDVYPLGAWKPVWSTPGK